MIAELCAKDWGLWRTATLTIAQSRERLGEFGLDADQQALIAKRLEALAAAIDAAPKSRAWRLRSRVGERVRWYEEPEEPEVEAHQAERSVAADAASFRRGAVSRRATPSRVRSRAACPPARSPAPRPPWRRRGASSSSVAPGACSPRQLDAKSASSAR